MFQRNRAVLAAALCGFTYTTSGWAQEPESVRLAQSAATTAPNAMFQFSTLTGTGGTLTATLVPVVTSTGAIVYKNVTLQFNVDASGNLTLATGFPQVGPSPTPIVSSFSAGHYVGPSTIYNGTMNINVSGPGITAGGATEWTLAAGTGANCNTYPGTATWYVGPLATSPLAARLSKAGITSTAWSYGVASQGSCLQSYNWYTDTLIGVSQVGNAITIVSFTYDNVDQNVPRDQITYTLAP